MRLLNCESKTFDEFVTPPQYAILSHTWEEDELSFGGMTAAIQSMTQPSMTLPPSVTNKQGWFKIENSCKQALADGYTHIWVDTICIDKTSSAELSEAINSMYRWYGDAAVCYVYLYDVALDATAPTARDEFGASRWFTRGWTLQEMIAPRRLEFYGRRWQPLGTKSARIDELVAITGVDLAVLGGGSVRLSSVACIVSWAARRTTTRVEDAAYSLLGLFDLSMAPLYGEGKRAFIRLQEEIIKEYDDDSIFAWCHVDMGSAGAGYTGILAESPAAFEWSADVAPVADRWRHARQPIAWTSYGVHISGMGGRMQRSGNDTSRLYFELSCCDIKVSPLHPLRETPIGLVLGVVSETDRRYVRYDIVGMPGAMPNVLQAEAAGDLHPMDVYVAKGAVAEIVRLRAMANQRAFNQNSFVSI